MIMIIIVEILLSYEGVCLILSSGPPKARAISGVKTTTPPDRHVPYILGARQGREGTVHLRPSTTDFLNNQSWDYSQIIEALSHLHTPPSNTSVQKNRISAPPQGQTYRQTPCHHMFAWEKEKEPTACGMIAIDSLSLPRHRPSLFHPTPAS